MVLNTLAEQFNVSKEMLIIILIWILIWKGLALWKSARLNQPVWFFLLFIVNTLGLLEIIYLLIYSNHQVQNLKIEKLERKKRKKR